MTSWTTAAKSESFPNSSAIFSSKSELKGFWSKKFPPLIPYYQHELLRHACKEFSRNCKRRRFTLLQDGSQHPRPSSSRNSQVEKILRRRRVYFLCVVFPTSCPFAIVEGNSRCTPRRRIAQRNLSSSP